MSSLPNANQHWIPDAKVRDFLLIGSTPKSRSRLALFQSYGFAPAAWRALRDALMNHQTAQVEVAREDQYGTTYRAIGPLGTPSGRRAKVEVFWIIRADDLLRSRFHNYGRLIWS
jgi:hypothetical protein